VPFVLKLQVLASYNPNEKLKTSVVHSAFLREQKNQQNQDFV
jgi:hypothetical protein